MHNVMNAPPPPLCVVLSLQSVTCPLYVMRVTVMYYVCPLRWSWHSSLVHICAVVIVGTLQYPNLVGLATSMAWGQSFTIPGGTNFNHIMFHFYKHIDGSPYATGKLYILTSATNGPPSLLASSNDLLAISTGIASVQGPSQWTFAPSVMLEAGRQYWAYMDQEASEQVSGHLNRVYSGGSGYQSQNDVNFAQTPGNPPGNVDIKFTCYGKPGVSACLYFTLWTLELESWTPTLSCRRLSRRHGLPHFVWPLESHKHQNGSATNRPRSCSHQNKA